MPVELLFKSSDKKEIREAEVQYTEPEGAGSGRFTELFSFALPFVPDEIVLDPNWRILRDPSSIVQWDQSEGFGEQGDN